MISALLIIVAILAIRFQPDAAISRLADRYLVRPLAGWLNKLDRRHLIFGLLVLLIVLLAGEMLAALGPLDMGLVLMWDVASFADALVATTLAASAMRLRPVRAWIGAVARVVPRRRERRPAAAVRKTSAANDEDGPAPALAA